MIRALVILLITGSAARAGDDVHGRHLRLRTQHGPVHVWTPAHYDAETAATVVYVHGYFTDVDRAWRTHHLAAQFRSSGINAVFVACGAPKSEADPVQWESLSELLQAVDTVIPLPNSQLIAVGHSGAHRTLRGWLEEPRLGTLILLDAGYRPLEPFGEWVARSDDHRLINVGDLTRTATDALHHDLPETVVVEAFERDARLPADAATARVLYLRSNIGHMELVTERRVLPALLEVASSPWVRPAPAPASPAAPP